MAQQTAYIDGRTYADVTGRDEVEATEQRMTRASRMLDARVGCWSRQTTGDWTGWRLPFDDLDAYQQEAVNEWVAWMTAALYDANDELPSGAAAITMGRFSIKQATSDDAPLAGKLQFADDQVVDAGLVKRSPYDDIATLPVA